MHKTVIGQITSANIAAMGKARYGYLGIETDDHEQLKVKVTAYTKFDTLDVGSKVSVEIETVGSDEILTAKTINNTN
jgi:hypothetical protein